jgi:FkbM family methyltransferase
MVFVDIGSYTGGDLMQLAKAQPEVQIYTFEPVPSVFKKLVERVSPYPNVHARNIGVGNTSDTLCFLKDRDATKMISKIGKNCPTTVSEEVHHDELSKAGVVETGRVMPVDVLFAEFKKIDVLQINCEGCEYTVLPAIYNSPAILSKIACVEVQFHNCEHETEKYCKVANRMKDKFDVVYNTDCQWTRFVKRM